ncbi:unnamed protein product [Cyclocybe aegerita]|uniref:NAD-dependent epimerase/dehydratase domain-containing protein n=1 Tax=Cyclocybe aegerita TaxID=1973307 RepID=A0A8S0WRG6_CYCAE|nr:unnamed protein product [Cyclocybe aegerita]
MAGELLLITGVSGHVGFRVLAEALQAGYRARAVVRRAEQATKIKATKSISPYADKVEFAVIPDLSVDGAFDAHTNGVSYILHVAAQQFTSVDVPIDVAEFAKSNIKFTENILEAAAKAPSVKRVLITSSITTLLTGEGLQGDSDLVLSWKSEVAKDLISPAPEKAVGPIAYVISKVLSAKLVEKFVEERKPHFTVASILLGTTIGRFELASESKELVSGSNIVPLAPLLGFPFPPTQSVFIHIDDAAQSHIKALTIDIAPGTVRKIVPVYNTAANPDAFTWDDSITIVKKHFPGVIESGAFPLGGTVPKRKCLVDSSEDEKVLGLKFKTYEEAVVDLITQFLTLAQAAQAAAA